jgi:NADPH:quinone reductase-like Zn-dependent oxidoreductase
MTDAGLMWNFFGRMGAVNESRERQICTLETSHEDHLNETPTFREESMYKQAMVPRFVAARMARLADGTIKPVIDSTFPLAEAATAHRRMEQHLNTGKIVLTTQQAEQF